MYIKKMDEREAADQAYKKKMADKHRIALHEQIEIRAKARGDGRASTFADGDRYRQERLAEVAKLDVIRNNMVKKLESAGVNPDYLSEMKNADILTMINKVPK